RRRHGEHDLRVPARQLCSAPPGAVGISPGPLLSLARLAATPRPGARAHALGTDSRPAGHSGAARRQPLPPRAPRPRSPSRARPVAHSLGGVSDAVQRTDTLEHHASSGPSDSAEASRVSEGPRALGVYLAP